MHAAGEPWFHFRWMLRNFYIWPVRWKGWMLTLFALLCGCAAFVLFPRWPGSHLSFAAALAAVYAAILWTVIRHAKAHYPQ